MKRRWWLVGAGMAWSIASAAPAQAYIDPGSGSYFIQVLVGAALGALFAVKMFWRRLWGFFRRSKKQS